MVSLRDSLLWFGKSTPGTWQTSLLLLSDQLTDASVPLRRESLAISTLLFLRWSLREEGDNFGDSAISFFQGFIASSFLEHPAPCPSGRNWNLFLSSKCTDIIFLLFLLCETLFYSLIAWQKSRFPSSTAEPHFPCWSLPSVLFSTISLSLTTWSVKGCSWTLLFFPQRDHPTFRIQRNHSGIMQLWFTQCKSLQNDPYFPYWLSFSALTFYLFVLPTCGCLCHNL